MALFARSEAVESVASALGGRATRGDIASAADLDRFVDETLAQWGRIDGAVLSTGHPPKGALLDLADADWHKGLDLVLLPVVRIARRITPQLRERARGHRQHLVVRGLRARRALPDQLRAARGARRRTASSTRMPRRSTACG